MKHDPSPCAANYDSNRALLVIETPRLTLRIPQEADLDSWAALLAHPESGRFIGGPLTRTGSWTYLARTVGHWQLRGCGFFSVMMKSSGECVGFAGPWCPEGWPGREVGWALRREYWGQGLAVEATAGVLQWVYRDLHWTDVIHCIHPDNKSSIAVAERLGSTLLRTEKLDVNSDIAYLIYGQDLSSSRK